MTTEPVYWYRLEDRLEGDERSSWVKVTCYKLLVVKETPKGVKLVGLQYGHAKPRFVGHGTKKQFACATIEQAVESFKKRKARQARILESQAAGAREAHDLAHTGDYNMMPDWFNPKPQETAHDI